MQTFLDTLHSVEVYYCKSNQFAETAFWQNLISILHPLTSTSRYNATVLPAVLNTTTGNWIDINNLRWNEDEAKKWCNGNTTASSLQRISVYFPSMEQCYEQKITPDIFIEASLKPSEKESRYTFVFMLALKRDFITEKGIDEAAMLHKLTDYLQPVFKIKKERPWAINENNTQYHDFLHDFFPSAIVNNGSNWQFREGYEGWQIF
ncbi:MAG: hypothetical protein JST86_06515 [Bacteroidetes bacterium]|nr:hypothetical protein [Bacteroidota bacterium]